MIDAPEPRLDHVLDIHIDLEAPLMLGATPGGNRQVWVVKGGSFKGPKLRGEVLSGGGDWAIARPDGATQLDVRATVGTDDGALIYITYGGLLVMTPPVMARLFGGEDVPLSEYYFYTTPLFQTSAEKYTWLNHVVAVARGKAVPGGVEYRVWAVQDPG